MTLMLKTYFWFIFVNLYTPVSYTSLFVHNQVKWNQCEEDPNYQNTFSHRKSSLLWTVCVLMTCCSFPSCGKQKMQHCLSRGSGTLTWESNRPAENKPAVTETTWQTGTPPTCSQEETLTLLWNVNFREQNRTSSADFTVSPDVWGSIRDGHTVGTSGPNGVKLGTKKTFWRLRNSDNQFEQTVLHCWSLFEYLAYRQFAPLFPSAAVFPSSTCSTRVFCRQSHEATWHRCWADNSVHSLYSIAIFWKELMLLMGDGATFPGLSPDAANIDLMWLISCFRFHCEKYLQIKTAPHQPHRSDVIVFF